jgi:hypothetical protein
MSMPARTSFMFGVMANALDTSAKAHRVSYLLTASTSLDY